MLKIFDNGHPQQVEFGFSLIHLNWKGVGSFKQNGKIVQKNLTQQVRPS
jgi:hypothetical protein